MAPSPRSASVLLLAAACGTDPTDKAGTDSAAQPTGDVEPEPDAPGSEPDPTDPWPDPAELPDGTVSLVHDGSVLSPGQSLTVATPPAGLPDPTALRLVLTNRTDDLLALPTDPAEWLVGDAFTWSEPPPTTLAPEESAALELTVSVAHETAATTHTTELTVPSGPTVTLVAEVPRPLRLVVVGTGHYTAVSDSYGATFETESGPDDTTTARDVVWGNGRFLRADRAYDDWSAPGVYRWSDDGLTWHDSASSDAFWASDCTHAWDRFYCVRESSWTSSDDGAVVLHDANGWGQLLNAVAYVPEPAGEASGDTGAPGVSGDRLVAVGRSGRRMLSVDGASWTADRSSSNPSSLQALAYGDGRLVAVGGTDSLVTAVSEDGGETWTETVLCESRYATFYTVVYGDGMFLASAQANDCAQVWRSVDGVDWTAVSDDRAFALAYTNGYFVGVTQPWGEAAQLIRSTDGSVWETVHTVPDGVGIQAAATERWERP